MQTNVETKDVLEKLGQEAVEKNKIEQEKTLLFQKKEELRQRGEPLASLVGVKLSPSRTYLRQTSLNTPRLEESETYIRSEKNPVIRSLGNQSHIYYSNEDLKNKKVTLDNGKRANAGDYSNVMQALGDRSVHPLILSKKERKETSEGDALLYDQLLKYKTNLCKLVVEKIRQSGGTSTITVGVYNDYPCVMVHISKQSIYASRSIKEISDGAFEEWVNFLISYFVGLINYCSYNLKIPIEMERRSSFGFLVPTIAPTNESIRINVGLVPCGYAELLAVCLKALDDILANQNRIYAPIPADCFYNSPEHREYLSLYSSDGKRIVDKLGNPILTYPPIMVDGLIQLLWAQVEKAGKTTVQNLVRTSYARDGIACEVFKTLVQKNTANPQSYVEAFVAGLQWAISKINIENSHLNVVQGDEISYGQSFVGSGAPCQDKAFWENIFSIVAAAKALEDSELEVVLQNLNDSCKKMNLDGLYSRLELLNELLFISSIKEARQNPRDYDEGSDSEEEEDIGGNRIFAKKVITHNGMRAIFSALLVAAEHLGKNKSKTQLYLNHSYYEVPLGLPLVSKLQNMPQITVLPKERGEKSRRKYISEANVILFDLNTCITHGKNINLNFENIKHKIVILDITSSTVEAVNQCVEKFALTRAAILFLVDSGFKHQQNGADKNQFGCVRVLTRDPKLRDQLLLDLKKHERPLTSPVAHDFRRKMKHLGMVPVMRRYLNPHKIKKPK